MSSSTTLETKTPPPTTEGGDSRRGRFDFSKPSEGPSAVFAKPVGQGKKRPPRSKDAQAKVAKEVKVPKESPKKPKAAVKEEPLPPLSATLNQEAWQKHIDERLKTFCTKIAVDGTLPA